MECVYATGLGSTVLEYCAGRPILVSYAYTDTQWVSTSEFEMIQIYSKYLYIDSGAFTKWNSEKLGKRCKNISVNSYIDWLHSGINFKFAFVFDVIGDAEKSLMNYELMRTRCAPDIFKKIAPVYHEGDPMEHLDHYIKSQDGLVGIGRTEGRHSIKKTMELYHSVFNRWYSYGGFHALGNGNPSTLSPFNFKTFDCTTWERAATYDVNQHWPMSHLSKAERIKVWVEALGNIRYTPPPAVDWPEDF